MTGSPEGGMPRRIVLGGLLAAGAAGALHLRNKGKEKPVEPPPVRKITAPREKKTEQVKMPVERGARSIFREQIEKDIEPTFGPTEAGKIDTYWRDRYKSTAGGAWIRESNARLGATIDDKSKVTHLQAIEAAFATEGVPKKFLYLTHVETEFKTFDDQGRPIRSRTGAIGAYQFQEGTAKEYGLSIVRNAKREIVTDERLDPVKAAGACARYLRYFAAQFKEKGASEDDAWTLAVYSYNGGFAQTYLLRNEKVSLRGFYEHLQQEMRKTLRQAESPRQHTIKRGDTLLKIAVRNQMPTAALRKANPQINWSSLRINSQITIPALSEAGPVHTVTAGDTFAKLLERYRIPAGADMTKMNPHITDWNGLKVGSEIRIPPSSPVYMAHIKAAKLGLLRGYVENIDYVSKFKAVIDVVGVK